MIFYNLYNFTEKNSNFINSRKVQITQAVQPK